MFDGGGSTPLYRRVAIGAGVLLLAIGFIINSLNSACHPLATPYDAAIALPPGFGGGAGSASPYTRKAERFSSMECIGGHQRVDAAAHRSCVLHDVCLILPHGSSKAGGEPRIEYYVDPTQPELPLLWDNNQLIVDFPPHFVQLGVYPHTGYVSPVVVRHARPITDSANATGATADAGSDEESDYSFAPLAILTAFFEEKSFGHFLVDALHATYYLQSLHGFAPELVDRRIQVIVSEWYRPGFDPIIVPKFRALFPALTRYYIQSVSEIAAHAASDSKRLCFHNLIIGAGGVSIQHFDAGVAASAERFIDFIRAGLGYTPHPHPSRYPQRFPHRILIARKSTVSTRGRHWINHERMIEALRSDAYFPGLSITEFVPESIERVTDEIKAMEEATVFVTPAGGGSFIASFLRPGASAVFGDVWGDTHRFDGAPREPKSRRYAAEDRWWTLFHRINNFHYPVCGAAELVPGAEQQPAAGAADEDFSDIRINIPRMADIIALAMAAAERRMRLADGTSAIEPYEPATRRALAVDPSNICR